MTDDRQPSTSEPGLPDDRIVVRFCQVCRTDTEQKVMKDGESILCQECLTYVMNGYHKPEVPS